MRSGAVAACCGAAIIGSYAALFCWFRSAHTAWFHDSPATIVDGHITRDVVWKPFVPLMWVDAQLTGRGAVVVDVHGIVWYVNGAGDQLGP